MKFPDLISKWNQRFLNSFVARQWTTKGPALKGKGEGHLPVTYREPPAPRLGVLGRGGALGKS